MDKAVKATEPITLDIAKAHCRVDVADDDGLFTAIYIPSAREEAEQYCGITILPTPGHAWVDSALCSAHSIPLPLNPVSSVDSITAHASDGTATPLDLAEYGASIARVGMRSVVITEKALPQADAFEVRYIAGYADGTCPPTLLRAMLLMIGDAYENREGQQSQYGLNTNPEVVKLLDPYRIDFGI